MIKKTELKDGMFVEFLNGKRAFCYHNTFVCIEESISFDNFNEVLVPYSESMKYYTITKVWKAEAFSSLDFVNKLFTTDWLYKYGSLLFY